MSRRRLDNNHNDAGNSDVSPNILITVLILAVSVILSASLYLLLRFLRRHRNNNTATTTTTTTATNLPLSLSSRHANNRVSPTDNNPLLDALPLFTFDSLKSTGDCAVCLSKFEEKDLLRLLPICCHVFHADCIDTWLNSNQSCPLCRSPVLLPESELLAKLGADNPLSASLSSSRSFRVEIGNVSQRNSSEIPVRRSYSLGGNFDYVVDDDVVSEVHSGSFRRTSSTTEFKVDDHNQQAAALAAEVGPRGGGGGSIGGGWLKDYLSNSLSSSLRSSGRWFFTGSSRRETGEFGVDNRVSELDLEASRLGDEIGELFRWLSGV